MYFSIYLKIDQPMAGEIVIPPTHVFDLQVAADQPPTSTTPVVASFWLSGRIVTPQSCQLSSANNIINFGSIANGELSLSEAPAGKKITRSFEIQCSGMGQLVTASLSLEGTPHITNKQALAVNERDDIAILLFNGEKAIAPVKPGDSHENADRIPLMFEAGRGRQKSAFDLTAYPIRTGPSVKPGPFSSQATVVFDFK